jgi:hypothetical protein
VSYGAAFDHRDSPRHVPGVGPHQSRDWYERVLGLQVLVDFPDDDGVVRGLAGLLPGEPPLALALRENPTAAAGASGFDPVSFSIANREAALAWLIIWTACASSTPQSRRAASGGPSTSPIRTGSPSGCTAPIETRSTTPTNPATPHQYRLIEPIGDRCSRGFGVLQAALSIAARLRLSLTLAGIPIAANPPRGRGCGCAGPGRLW